jgi:hypothetical protein
VPLWLIFPGIIVALFLLTVLRGAPYVPSRKADLKRAFTELYPLTKKDLLVDIGSGDGVVLRQAATHGARALGYELNPVLVAISRVLSRRFGELVQVKLADFWYVKLPPETTIVYTFGESRDINRMYDKVRQEASRLQKPLYFMSYGFEVKDAKELKTDKSFHLYHVTPGQK